MNERTFCIQTFGCQMNINDSGWLARALVRRGFVETTPQEARVHIVNTCSVRDKPEQKVYSALGRIRQITAGNREAFAVVAGCVAQQIGSGFFDRFPQVRLVVGGDGLAMAPDAIEKLCDGKVWRLNLTDFTAEYPERDPEVGESAAGNATIGPTAYVNIMQGCDNFCAYCIVPYTRGRQKSRRSAAVIAECRAMLDHGACELVLLGQNVNAFGQDSHGDGTTFPQLLHEISALPGLRRLRFVTSHPKDFAQETVAAFAELPVLMPSLHLPVQSGSDVVLARMRRRYTRSRYLRLVEALYRARPDLALTTDIIVGFPGETEQDFAQTLSIMREVSYASSFSFCYSDRPGAAASSFPDKVPADVARLRLERLQSLQQELTDRCYAERVGRQTEIILEGPSRRNLPGSRSWQGRDPWGAVVHVALQSGSEGYVGRAIEVRLTKALKHSLIAEEMPALG